MNATHFTGRHHYDGESSGPFGFLNPTTRKYALPSQARKKEPSQEGSQHTLVGGELAHPSNAKKDEIRAEDVLLIWRTRDNRKGKLTAMERWQLPTSIGDFVLQKSPSKWLCLFSTRVHQLRRSKKPCALLDISQKDSLLPAPLMNGWYIAGQLRLPAVFVLYTQKHC